MHSPVSSDSSFVASRVREGQRARNRPLIRTVVILMMGGYMLLYPHPPEDAEKIIRQSLWLFIPSSFIAIGIFIHIILRPAANPKRRIFGMLMDVVGTNAAMVIGGAAATIFYPVLLWLIFGHGFRFGNPYLFAAAGSSIVLFTCVHTGERCLAIDARTRHCADIGVGDPARLCLDSAGQAQTCRLTRRGGEPCQEPVSREYEPRVPNTAQRHHRHDRSLAGEPARRRSERHGRHHTNIGSQPPFTGQRRSRHRQDRESRAGHRSRTFSASTNDWRPCG